jgi:FtsZ-binding cell division protein ZapB
VDTSLPENVDRIALSTYQSMGEELPRYAQGLFDEPPGPGMRRKRRRLTEFTEDEKQARRKLKNRIAAQTARDRKRVENEFQVTQLDHLQMEVNRLREDNESLRKDNASLRADNSRLRDENNTLRENAWSGSSQNVKQERVLGEIRDITRNSSTKLSKDEKNFEENSVGSTKNTKKVMKNDSLTKERGNLMLRTEGASKKVVDPLVCPDARLVKSTVTTADRPLMPGRVALTNNSRIQPQHTQFNDSKTLTSPLMKTHEQMSAFYLLILTMILETASKIMKSTDLLNEQAPNTATRSLTRRIKFAQLMKRSYQSAKGSTPLMGNQPWSLSPTQYSPITPWLENLIPNKSPQLTTTTSTTSSKVFSKTVSKEPQSSMKIFSTSTTKRSQFLKAAAQQPPKRNTLLFSPETSHSKEKITQVQVVGQAQTACPLHHARIVPSCLACVEQIHPNGLRPPLSKVTVLRLNVADQLIRQVNHQVERKRRLERETKQKFTRNIRPRVVSSTLRPPPPPQ